MPELGTQLRDYLEAAAPPITEEEVRLHPVVRVPATSPTTHRRRRLLPAFVMVALVAVALVAAGLLRSPGPETPVVGPGPDAWRGIWPQTSRWEAERAQARADAGDPAFAWQAPGNDPDGNIARRFVREQLGWSEGRGIGQNYLPRDHEGQDWEAEVVEWYVIRCGGGTNPLYPNDPVGGNCPPTIDETRYQVARVNLEQLMRRGPSGIWMVTGWEDVTGSPGTGVQAVPPSEEEVRRLMEDFLEARLEGNGAERYVGTLSNWNDPVWLNLYATSGGSPYERYEITSVSGPEWPSGTFRLSVRLTAQDGTVVSEGTYMAGRNDVRLRQFNSNVFTVSEE